MNPDGTTKIQRGNGNGVDLNRNFPDILRDNPSPPIPPEQEGNGGWRPRRNSSFYLKDVDKDKYEPETLAIMNWHRQRKFSMSANFHGGAVVMNYMWDSKTDRHPLDELLQEIASVYADLNPTMKSSREFEGGITNGADWFLVKGGMQDYSYVFFNDLQYTIELSQEKYPDFAKIPKFYKENKSALLEFLKQIHRGKGFVWKNQSGYVEIISKKNRKNLGVFQFSNEFYKVLPEGDYQFTILDSSRNIKKIIEVNVDENIHFNNKYLLIN
jgi:carboxypeptidase D